MSLLNKENWNYCHYKNENLKAIISFGAEPSADDSIVYFATLLDEENNEIFQQKFSDLDAACNHLNEKYHDIWEFTDLVNKAPSSGCSTCVAH